MTFTKIKKPSQTWQKFANDYNTIQLQNQQFTNNTLHVFKCSTELLVFSKCVLKKFANFLFFSGFSTIFQNIFLLELFWTSASDFTFDIFKSNNYMKVSFPLIVFYRKKQNKAKKPIGSKTGKSYYCFAVK